MKRLAKVFRRWADKLDPRKEHLVEGCNMVYTPLEVLPLRKLKSQVEISNPGDQREREVAERKLKEDLVREALKGVKIEMYNRHVVARFYYYG